MVIVGVSTEDDEDPALFEVVCHEEIRQRTGQEEDALRLRCLAHLVTHGLTGQEEKRGGKEALHLVHGLRDKKTID